LGEDEIALFLLKLGVIILLAKICGDLVEKYLKQPGVLGELISGIIISPYLLGPHVGFELVKGKPIPVSDELELAANFSVVLLLFIAGVETDVEGFFKHFSASGLVGLGGILLPFVFGYFTVYHLYEPPPGIDVRAAALFAGAFMTATSVGITARVLRDMGKLNTPEGVTTLSAAVIDDVLGILTLSIVVELTQTGSFTLSHVLWTTLKAFAFWLALLYLGRKFSNQISSLLHIFGPGGQIGIAVSIGLIFSYLAYAVAGLAPIIGAYAAGLALASSAHKEFLGEALKPLYEVLVPVFFVMMGMIINPFGIKGVVTLSVIIVLLAIVGKHLGCFVAAKVSGFSLEASNRIGVGMIPRGEVGLIIAYYGLNSGAIGPDLYTVAVVMSFLTTLITPPLLKLSFRGTHSGKEK